MTNHYSNILEKLEAEYRAVERYYGQTVYKLSKDGFVYLRYSKREKAGKEKYFFGLDKDAIERLKRFDFTVILVCGEEDINFMLNKDFILSIIDGLKISGSRWLINIYNAKNVWYLKVSGKKRIDISDFKNRFDLMFSKIIYLEKEITKEEFREEKGKPELIELSETEKIKSDLISSSIKSDKPSLFEEAIASCFKFLGFECEHIGGAGNTDVLVSIPYRLIIEAKTTTRGSIGKIYFTRLKQHKEKHNADFIAVICNDFEQSVIRDAEIEDSLLIQTKLLCRLLDLNDEYPLSPFDLKYIFQLKGLSKEEDLQNLRNRLVTLKEKIGNLSTLIQSIDNQKRNLDEIFGRYKMKCTALNTSTLDKIQFKNFIDFLAMPFMAVIIKENSLYYREVSEDVAMKRLNKIGGGIYETSK
ncbi:MAG: restriction endonuclease [Candidatus Aminicenantes bacterium]|nr:restriction endonuclease [Candidatus Aminicenantes bacterium]